MWDEDPDIFDAMDEHEFENDSVDDFADLELASEMGELSEGEAFEEYGSYFDDEG